MDNKKARTITVAQENNPFAEAYERFLTKHLFWNTHGKIPASYASSGTIFAGTRDEDRKGNIAHVRG